MVIPKFYIYYVYVTGVTVKVLKDNKITMALPHTLFYKRTIYMQPLKKLDIFAILIFFIYLIFPFETPAPLAKLIDSPIGILIIFCVCVYLFVNENIILAFLYLFVAYELFRRSSIVNHVPAASSQYVPRMTEVKKRDTELKKMNEPLHVSLEEQMIAERAPLGISTVSEYEYTETGFRPLTEKTISGSSIFS